MEAEDPEGQTESHERPGSGQYCHDDHDDDDDDDHHQDSSFFSSCPWIEATRVLELELQSLCL